MKKQELIDYINKHDNGETENGFEFKLNIEHFGNQIDILVDNISSVNAEPQISILTEIITDLQLFNPNKINWFKEKIWNHYSRNMKSAWFGFVNYEGFQNEEDANYAHFKFNSKDDAYKALKLGCVVIYVYKKGIRNFDLVFSCPWELEHGITIGVSNHQFSHIE